MAYSVQEETRAVFLDGIIKNDLMKEGHPSELEDTAQLVTFTGNPEPSVPINWRFAESVSALKAYEASMLAVLLSRKYGARPSKITINTDHASLFYMSPLIARWKDEDGAIQPLNPQNKTFQKLFPDCDLHKSLTASYRGMCTSLYKTKDGRHFHVHGSMNADHSLGVLGLPPDVPNPEDVQEAGRKIQSVVSQMTSSELDEKMNDQARQAGTIAQTIEEYFSSEDGKANSKAGLFEVSQVDGSSDAQKPSWWPENSSKPSSAERPLAGLKVVDLTRIIAGPSITRSLAELGASIMRATSSKLPDLSMVHHDLNWGKWNCTLDLKDESDREKLRALIREADVVVDGYRPGSLEKLGFGQAAVLDLVKSRDRGIIYVRENCYGWHGPKSGRIGWQQISDACCGISTGFGKAIGADGPVTPVFPNSDFCTGIAGSTGVLQALISRAERGGSYFVDTALNYYSAWLARSVGTYPEPVWSDLWRRHGSITFQSSHNMQTMIPAMLRLLYEKDGDVVFNPSFFEPRLSKALQTLFFVPKPVASFEGVPTKLGYDIGTRGNGVDEAEWPIDLTVEVVRSGAGS